MEWNECEMNTNYKYSLDKSSKKFTCPSCGKTRFVRYIDTSNNNYLPLNFGRCDREINCGYHLKPYNYAHNSINTSPTPMTPISKEPDYIPAGVCSNSLNNYKQNNFIQFLKTIFPRETISNLIRNFFIGTSTFWPGAAIFWQIDKNGKIHSGKIMLYDQGSGKRVKEPFPHIQWIHKVIQIKDDFNLKQCLFGEHQLIECSDDKMIAIVESEKTAIIMSGFFPHYIWMATGSLSNVNPYLFSSIINRDIILYPDLNGFSQWNEKATLLIDQGYKVIVSDLLELKAPSDQKKEGSDIADFFISSLEGGGLKDRRVLALTSDDIIFNQMANKNPCLIHLANSLCLVNPRSGKPFAMSNLL